MRLSATMSSQERLEEPASSCFRDIIGFRQESNLCVQPMLPLFPYLQPFAA